MGSEAIVFALKAQKMAKANAERFVYVQKIFSNKIYVWLPVRGTTWWTRYDLRLFVDSTINLNAWRIYTIEFLQIAEGEPVPTATQTNILNPISAGANFEYAIRIQGATDYFGGQHGDEVLQNVGFVVDGKLTPISSLTSHKCRQFDLVQQSVTYSPLDGTSKAGDMNCRWIFKPGEMNLQWKHVWASPFTVDLAYGAMLPAQRGGSSSNRCRYLDEAVENNISTSGHALAGRNSTGIVLYNTTNNLQMSVEFQDAAFFNGFKNSAGKGIWVYDGTYNKVYPSRVYTPSTETIVAGDIWMLNAKFTLSS